MTTTVTKTIKTHGDPSISTYTTTYTKPAAPASVTTTTHFAPASTTTVTEISKIHKGASTTTYTTTYTQSAVALPALTTTFTESASTVTAYVPKYSTVFKCTDKDGKDDHDRKDGKGKGKGGKNDNKQ